MPLTFAACFTVLPRVWPLPAARVHACHCSALMTNPRNEVFALQSLRCCVHTPAPWTPARDLSLPSTHRTCGPVLAVVGCGDVPLFFFKKHGIPFLLPWVFIAVCKLALAAASEGPPELRCAGFSRGLRALGPPAPAAAARLPQARAAGSRGHGQREF